MAFWKTLSLTDQAVAAVDRIEEDIEFLRADKEDALSAFRSTADRLDCINQQLCEKTALCGTLIAQLSRTQDSINQQVSDNEKVRAKILDIIGE